MNSEIWKAIHVNPDYEVSSLGRVRRRSDGHCTVAGRLVKPVFKKGKYLAISLGAKGGRKQYRLNRLVCHTFHGPPPTSKHQAAHLNGRHGDNRAENVKWKTGKENKADELLHGTRTRGDRHGSAKLSTGDVIKIRNLLGRIPNAEIARIFGVHQCTIGDINKRRTWKWLT